MQSFFRFAHALSLLLSVILSHSVVAQDSRWIDLTYSLSADSVFWPTAKPFKLTTDAEGVTEAGYYYSAHSFTAAEDGGTPIDALVHFAEGKYSVNKISLGQLIGPAMLIDGAAPVSANRDYLVSIDDIINWGKTNDPIPDQSIVLFRNGLGALWPNTEPDLGTSLRGVHSVAALSFSGLSAEAATWLIENRRDDAKRAPTF